MEALPLHSILTLVALATSVFVVVLGCVLSYHWVRFAMSPFATFIALISYCAVSATLLLALFTALYIV